MPSASYEARSILLPIAHLVVIGACIAAVWATFRALYSIALVGVGMSVDKAITPQIIGLAGDAIFDFAWASGLTVVTKIAVAVLEKIDK